jgi:ribose transport system ATP-binding protein
MNAATQGRPILEMRHITKRFPGVLALDDVDFSANRGEIHSVIGQNGAGKSTLMKILAGDYAPTNGEILIDGVTVSFSNQREARARGIAIVYQELSLLPNLTVAENIFLGKEPGGFVIDETEVHAEAKQVLDQLGINIDVDQRLEELPLAQQQLVEIAKALSFKPQILILDEPTAALAPRDAEHLFAILARLKQQDIAIIYISHRLKEILEHCDRGTILRNGKVVKVQVIEPNTTEEDLIEPMIGQELESFYRQVDGAKEGEAHDVLLEAENLVVGDRVKGVDFALRSGEILGITGLLGAGQNELARALFGLLPHEGTVRRHGRAIRLASPQEAIAHGICLLTENRKEEGLFLDMSVKENITMPSLPRFKRSLVFPFIANRAERRAARDFIDRVNVILSTPDARVRTLSGGNQQKAILARWLLRNLEVLVFVEPTRGIDVGAKAEIYRYLDLLATEGRGIIVISPELTEILGISDRILVMREGKLAREFAQHEATEEALLAAIQGAVLNHHKEGVEGVEDDGDYTAEASTTTAIN